MALSADRRLTSLGPIQALPAPAVASTVWYAGSILAYNANGYVQAATLAAGRQVCGIAAQACAGTTTAGDVVGAANVGMYWLPNSAGNPVLVGHCGRNCYVEDDEKVRCFLDSEVNIPVGKVIRVDSSLGVLVDVGVVAAIPEEIVAYSGQDVVVQLSDAAGARDFVIEDSAGSEVLTINSDGDITPAATADLVINLGDAAGARALSIHDSGDVEVAFIDSNGDTSVHDLTVTGTYTAIAGISAPAGSDFTLTAAAGFDLVLVQGDAAGANEVSFRDSGGVEHATIDSDGNAQFDGTLGVTGIATFTAAPVLNGGAGVAAGQAITGVGAMTVGVAGGAFDLSLKLGDAGGAQKLSVKDSANAEVAYVNSNGLIACAVAEGMIGGYQAAAITEPPTDGELALIWPTLNATNGGFGFVTNTAGTNKTYLCLKCAGAGVWKTVELT